MSSGGSSALLPVKFCPFIETSSEIGPAMRVVAFQAQCVTAALWPQPCGPVPSGTRMVGTRHWRCVALSTVAGLTGSGIVWY